jgi:hypothetical protein
MESVVNYVGFTKKKIKIIKKTKIVNKALISMLKARIIKYSGVDKGTIKPKR